MNMGDTPFDVKRILVAVDASRADTPVLETAAQLASAFDAELIGIFVEDINLLRLAALPFVREVSWTSAIELTIDHQRMERTLRGYATYAQQAVINITSPRKLRSSLKVVRGHVAQELLRATENVDLLILGKGRDAGETRIGSIPAHVLQEANCPVLLVAHDILHHHKIMTLYIQNEDSERIVKAAARIAHAIHKSLQVLIPAVDTMEYENLREQARQFLGSEQTVSYRRITSLAACFNQNLIRDEGIGLLVIGGSQITPGLLETQLGKLACSVLLVR